jgi:hypothetical protein
MLGNMMRFPAVQPVCSLPLCCVCVCIKTVTTQHGLLLIRMTKAEDQLLHLILTATGLNRVYACPESS